jgi:polyisoprenoid-binding protein YceI
MLDGMPAGEYELDVKHASIVWKVDHFGFSTYPGRFTDFEVALNLDPQAIENSSVKVDIDVTSIETEYPFPEKEDFNKVLANDWFKSAEFPTISFVSTAVSGLQDDKFTITGDLTMLGKTLPATLDATLNKATTRHPLYGKPVIGFSATTRIERTQWGLSKFAPGVGAEVLIEIEGEFSAAAE